MSKAKGTRVWVAVESDGRTLPRYAGNLRAYVESQLDREYPAWKSHGLTIRRATLTLDPVKKRTKRRPA